MGMGIPHGPVPNYYFNKYGEPDRVPRTKTRGGSVNSFEECLATIREDFKNQMRETSGVELSNKSRVYQKPYPSHFDLVPYPVGWRTPDFVKFNGEDNRTTWGHISQYLVQLGKVGSIVALKVCLFSLSLTSTVFSLFSSLSPNSIDSWEQLEHKFHDHFYSPENELKLLDLTSVRQGHDESVKDYIRRFRYTKTRCFNLMISEKDMVDLAFNGLHSYLWEKLDGHTFIILSQLQQKSLAHESRGKENKDNFKDTCCNVNYVDCDSDSSSDESNEIYAAEFCWPSKAKSYACNSLKPVHKNGREEIKFTFDVGKCDKIFYELHKAGCIKMSHTISPLDELK
jgi:hypothetical protein